ncbi:hypothetical protein, partial [Dialister sp.]|uniref:hypothetical protein n=1 Tax=Dialister sp. TaxID=1955814 RepID=UPI002E80C6A6
MEIKMFSFKRMRACQGEIVNKILMIQIAFFATIPVERMKGPLKKSLITRMYTIDRTGGGMDADDFQKLRNRA